MYELIYRGERSPEAIFETQDEAIDIAKRIIEDEYKIHFRSVHTFCRSFYANMFRLEKVKTPKKKKGNKGPKEFLYVGHYIDIDGNYILKVGTTNDLDRRQREHNHKYRYEIKNCIMRNDSEFVYDWHIALSKYNTLRFEDSTREKWKNENLGEFVQNDRFNCGTTKPEKVRIMIRKTYEIML